MLFGSLVFNAFVLAGNARSIEVFTTSDHPVTGADHERLQAVVVTMYAVDGLEQFQSKLSEGLPIDPEAAKVAALHRVRQLDDAHMAPAKNAVIGVAKAVQYGIDRYPVIVFDGRAAVYGVMDLINALDRYDAWQRGQAQ